MSVYFITCREVGRVKIGYTKNPQARIVSIQTHSPLPLVLERVQDGGKDEEKTLHEKFADYRVRGEWFTITKEIEAYMKGLDKHIWRHRGLTNEMWLEYEAEERRKST